MKIDFYIDLNKTVTYNLNQLNDCGLLMTTKPFMKTNDSDRIKVTVDFPNQYFKEYCKSEGIVTNLEIIKENQNDN